MADQYDRLIAEMLKSDALRELYDTCIIKSITFKEWVVGMVDRVYMINQPITTKVWRTFEETHNDLGSLE